MKALLAGICVCLTLAAVALAAETISKGDRVELVNDAPLFFNDTLARTGKRGEQFTVLLVQAHQVFVSARDERGQEVALHVSEEMVARVTAGRVEAAPPANVPATLASRLTPALRARALAAMGGSAPGEEAVVRGLRFLVHTQNPDGSWAQGSKSYLAAMTGFSVLAFLGHGETPDSAEFGRAVKAGVAWLVANGRANDGRMSVEPAFSQPGVYAHGIATFALAEYYAMTKDATVVDLLTKAVAHIVEGQGPDGGWMYSYDKTEGDTSVSGWQIQALKAAHLTGLNLPNVDTTLDKAMLNLNRVRGPKGGYGYHRKADGYSLTGVGIYCTCTWTQARDMKLQESAAFLLDQTKANYPVKYMGEKGNLYAWYYDTLACAAIGGAAWNTWNRMFRDELVKNQSPDGSWPVMAKGTTGGGLQADPAGAGPCYRTTLCILMLESYYRYGWGLATR